MAELIKATGERSRFCPDNGKHYSLELLQSLVSGYIEPVHLPFCDFLVFNEDGKLHGLPKNYVATAMALDIMPNDYVVGDVVLFSSDEWLDQR